MLPPKSPPCRCRSTRWGRGVFTTIHGFLTVSADLTMHVLWAAASCQALPVCITICITSYKWKPERPSATSNSWLQPYETLQEPREFPYSSQPGIWGVPHPAVLTPEASLNQGTPFAWVRDVRPSLPVWTQLPLHKSFLFYWDTSEAVAR